MPLSPQAGAEIAGPTSPPVKQIIALMQSFRFMAGHSPVVRNAEIDDVKPAEDAMEDGPENALVHRP